MLQRSVSALELSVRFPAEWDTIFGWKFCPFRGLGWAWTRDPRERRRFIAHSTCPISSPQSSSTPRPDTVALAAHSLTGRDSADVQIMDNLDLSSTRRGGSLAAMRHPLRVAPSHIDW